MKVIGQIISCFLVLWLVQSMLCCNATNTSEMYNVTKFYNQSGYEVFNGFIPVRDNNESKLYYILVSANGSDLTDTTRPLIIWLQGGPGCSSQLAAHLELGPFIIKENKTANSTKYSVTENPFGWSLDNHMLFVDQPIGVGFSIIKNASWPKNSVEASLDFERFLKRFFELYPNLLNNDLYIFGESYAGHYVPAFAAQILKNQSTNKINNLKGIGIGDGWVDLQTQVNYYAAPAFSEGIINPQRKRIYKAWENEITRQSMQGNRNLSAEIFINYTGDASESPGVPSNESSIPSLTGIAAPPLNFENYKSGGLDYLIGWFNLNETKNGLNIPSEVDWISCQDPIYRAFYEDFFESYKNNISYILNSARVLIYNGQNDLDNSLPGSVAYLNQLSWSGLKSFQDTKKQIWRNEGQVAGTVKQYSNLTVVAVYNAGHMVPLDQRSNALNMLRRFINKQNDWSQKHQAVKE